MSKPIIENPKSDLSFFDQRCIVVVECAFKCEYPEILMELFSKAFGKHLVVNVYDALHYNAYIVLSKDIDPVPSGVSSKIFEVTYIKGDSELICNTFGNKCVRKRIHNIQLIESDAIYNQVFGPTIMEYRPNKDKVIPSYPRCLACDKILLDGEMASGFCLDCGKLDV